MLQAVCAVILMADKFLSVSRKNNPNDIGLPGGKVDPGETPEKAIVREVFEETGYKVEIIKELIEQIDGDYLVKTFYCRIVGGDPKTSETGVVRWVVYDELTNPMTSFCNYNIALKPYLP